MRIETNLAPGLGRKVYAYPEATDVIRTYWEDGSTIGWETPGGGITFASRDHGNAVTVYLDEDGFLDLRLALEDTLARIAAGGSFDSELRRTAPAAPFDVPRFRLVAVLVALVCIAILAANRWGWFG